MVIATAPHSFTPHKKQTHSHTQTHTLTRRSRMCSRIAPYELHRLLNVIQHFLGGFWVFFSSYFSLFKFVYFNSLLFLICLNSYRFCYFCNLIVSVFLIQSRLRVSSAFYVGKRNTHTQTLIGLICFIFYVSQLDPKAFCSSAILVSKAKHTSFKSQSACTAHTIKHSPTNVGLQKLLCRNFLSSCFVSLGTHAHTPYLSLSLSLFCSKYHDVV